MTDLPETGVRTPGATTDFTPELQVVIARVRDEVADLHGELARYGLVTWATGSVSARVPGADLFVVKPGGVAADDLGPENLILCDLDGRVIPDTPGSERKPVSDAAAHAHVYRNLPGAGGIVHTLSPYATAWSARGEAIPCVITAMADEFGGDIPVGPSALADDEALGAGIVATLDGHRSRAVLMREHGPFTVGADAADAVKAAVMLEDVARAVHLSRQLGEPARLPADAVDALFARYQNVYGQPSRRAEP